MRLVCTPASIGPSRSRSSVSTTPPTPLPARSLISKAFPPRPSPSAAFLELLCRRTLDVSDDWRHGALAPDVTLDQLDTSANAIATAFERAGSTSTYYPCHRLVLSFTESDDVSTGIPESARVVEGPTNTTSFTMSLFNLASGTGTRTWGDLVRAVDGQEAPWRQELDGNFLRALDERLFAPSQASLAAPDRARGDERCYFPILYSIVRGPAVRPMAEDHTGYARPPRNLTILLQPQARTAPRSD